MGREPGEARHRDLRRDETGQPPGRGDAQRLAEEFRGCDVDGAAIQRDRRDRAVARRPGGR